MYLAVLLDVFSRKVVGWAMRSHLLSELVLSALDMAASAANHAYVRGLGADEIMDYRTEDFTRRIPACDAVFDTVGGAPGPRPCNPSSVNP